MKRAQAALRGRLMARRTLIKGGSNARHDTSSTDEFQFFPDPPAVGLGSAAVQRATAA